MAQLLIGPTIEVFLSGLNALLKHLGAKCLKMIEWHSEHQLPIPSHQRHTRQGLERKRTANRWLVCELNAQTGKPFPLKPFVRLRH